MIDALRTMLVWGVDLVIFYAGLPAFGEPWNNYRFRPPLSHLTPHITHHTSYTTHHHSLHITHRSFIQLGGFVFLVAGTLMYKEILKVAAPPCTTSIHAAQFKCLPHEIKEKESEYPPLHQAGVSKKLSYIN